MQRVSTIVVLMLFLTVGLLSAPDVIANKSVTGKPVVNILDEIAKKYRSEYKSYNRCWGEGSELYGTDSKQKAAIKKLKADYKKIVKKHEEEARKAGKKKGSTKDQTILHDITMDYGKLVNKTPRIGGFKVGNCQEIASDMYQHFFETYSGIRIGVVRYKNPPLFLDHSFLLVRCGNKKSDDLYIVDGWNLDGVAVGPVKLIDGKLRYMDGSLIESSYSKYVLEIVTVGKTALNLTTGNTKL